MKTKPKNRFLQSVIKTAAKETPLLPWVRGARRKAFIYKRSAALALRTSA